MRKGREVKPDPEERILATLDDEVELDDANAQRIHIPKDEIHDRKRSDVSLMPNGLAEGLTLQDFADLIAYLETLKDHAAQAGAEGGPDRIEGRTAMRGGRFPPGGRAPGRGDARQGPRRTEPSRAASGD